MADQESFDRIKERAEALAQENEELRAKLREKNEKDRHIASLASFPLENLDPVLRVCKNGIILFANAPALNILKKWSVGIDDPIPEPFLTTVQKAIQSKRREQLELGIEGLIYLFRFAGIPKMDYVNVYGNDVTERIKAEALTLKSKQEAEKANRAKSEFLSNMSHELRTPMNAIIGFAKILKRNKAQTLSERQKESVNEILKASLHLLELINDILDLTRIESGKLTLSLEPVDAKTVIDEVLSMAQPLAQKRNIEIRDAINENENLFVEADRTRLKQVLLNLASNAIKYNIENGTASLDCNGSSPEKLRINITDTGKGISPNHFQSLFEPFNRLEADLSFVEGVGIGLTITKQLLELMGGSIGLTSEVGKGSCFSIELERIQNPGLQSKAAEASRRQEPSNLAGRRYTVLYIEDNPANLRLVEQILSDELPEAQLLSAPHAQLGIDLAQAHRPNLILMDINLPGMDGLEAFKELQQIQETKDVPVVAISANAMKKDIKKALELGFKEYIVKPIDPQELLDSMEKYLK